MRASIVGLIASLLVTTFSAAADVDAEAASPQEESASAQEGTPSADRTAGPSATLDEVVVTAQRREQSLQDVPISATVISGEVIEQIGAQGLHEILAHSVNVDAGEDGGSSNNVDLAIRGVRPLFDGNQNTFGVFYDGFNVAPVAIDLSSTGTIYNNSLIDLDRVEVLRGPQGTYFGRNVMGGAISMVTKKPDEHLYYRGSVDSARFGTLDLRGLVNLPLTDNLFMRLSGQKFSTDGAVKNYGPGRSLRYTAPAFPQEFPRDFGTSKWDQSTSWSEVAAARAAIRYLPTDRLTIDVTHMRQVKERGPMNIVNFPGAYYDPGNPDDVAFFTSVEGQLGSLPPDPLGLGYWPQNQSSIALSEANGATSDASITTANVNYQFGSFALESITGYIDVTIDSDRDRDASLALRDARSQYAMVDSFSQEIRAFSTWDKPVQWLLGVMFAEDTDDGLRVDYRPGGDAAHQHVLFESPEAEGLSPALRRFNRTLAEFETRSIFGEVSWAVTDRLDVALGGRYAEDESNESATDWTADLVRSDQTPVRAKGSAFSPKVSVSFDITDNLKAYAVAARGYRPGGSNSVDIIEAVEQLATDFGVTLNIDPVFNEEILTNYEIGAKGRFLDNRLQINAAVFRMDYSDLQTEAFLPLPAEATEEFGLFFELTQNAAGASIDGVELEFAALLGQRLELRGGVGLLDATFDSYQFLDGDGKVLLDISGHTLPRARDWSAYLSGLYTYPINTIWNGFVRGDLTALSDAPQDRLGRYPERQTIPNYPGYEVFNLRLGFETDQFSIAGYVNNLFEEDYYTFYKGDAYGAGVDVHPRTYGVRFAVSYGGASGAP